MGQRLLLRIGTEPHNLQWKILVIAAQIDRFNAAGAIQQHADIITLAAGWPFGKQPGTGRAGLDEGKPGILQYVGHTVACHFM